MIITVNSVLPDDKGNQYKVISNIKPGGFGQVFLCERIQDKKMFALVPSAISNNSAAT